jgi:hypothetical protein
MDSKQEKENSCVIKPDSTPLQAKAPGMKPLSKPDQQDTKLLLCCLEQLRMMLCQVHSIYLICAVQINHA